MEATLVYSCFILSLFSVDSIFGHNYNRRWQCLLQTVAEIRATRLRNHRYVFLSHKSISSSLSNPSLQISSSASCFTNHHNSSSSGFEITPFRFLSGLRYLLWFDSVSVRFCSYFSFNCVWNLFQDRSNLVDDPRRWGRKIISARGGGDDDEEDDGDGDGDDDEEERSLDLLVRFLHNMFKKLSKRARKAVRSVLPHAISTKLVRIILLS